MSSLTNRVPVAMLVIYEIGFKLKYKKYYLGRGHNYIGSHPACQVIITGERVPAEAVNITISEDMAAIEAYEENCLHVPSNLKKRSNLMVSIRPGTNWIIEMEKDFIICERKALIQISPLEELLQVRGVENSALFDLSIKNGQEYIQKNNSKNFVPIQNRKPEFEPTIPIDEPNVFDPTLLLEFNQPDQFEATQLISENDDFDPTIPLDDEINYANENRKREEYSFSEKKQKNNEIFENRKSEVFSNSLPSQSKNAQFENKKEKNESLFESEFDSMPETIKEEDIMPATIKADDDVVRESQVFPQTIEADDIPIKKEESQKKAQNMTRSEPVYRQIKREKFEKVESNHFQSLEERKPVHSFEDLFGGVEQIEQSYKTISMHSSNKSSQEKQPARQIREIASDNESNKTEKVESDKEEEASNYRRSSNLNKINEAEYEESQGWKKCCIFGKVGKSDQEKLRKKGYSTIKESELEDSDLDSIDLVLYEGELKLNKKIMIFLIQGKEIHPTGWLTNQSLKASGKLMGFLWEHIIKRKGKGTSILNTGKNYYLQEELRDEYNLVLAQAGATLIPTLNQSKARTVIHLILDEKTKEGKELYDNYCNYKKWNFYSKRMIIESILMGEEILDKYQLDADSF